MLSNQCHKCLGLYFIKKLLKTNVLRAYDASLNRKPFPGCENHTFDTREYWKCYVQHLTLTSYHPIGTCRISDVVDKSFRYLLHHKIKIIRKQKLIRIGCKMEL